MQEIKLNKNTKIDLAKFIDSRLLVQANSGGGKSWLIRRILEQSHGKVQQIVIDLEGEFSTLREKYDYILCGKGGDTPADPRSAGILAKKLLELNVSAIIDLYELNHFDRKRFVRLFLEAMVNAPKELWHSVIVVIDEAHVFCPEKGQSEASEAVIDLATRGRKRGYCAVLATQRLSKLHKDAAAECNNKLIGRTGLDVDMKRAYDELGFNTKEQYLSLRNLEAGEFFAFGPAISKEVIKVKIGEVSTTHPSSQNLNSRIQTKTIPPTAKIKAILAKLADLPAEAKKEAQTTAEMKKEIANLKRELTIAKVVKKIPGSSITKIQRIEVPTIGKRALEGLIESEKKGRIAVRSIKDYAGAIDLSITKLLVELNKIKMQPEKQNITSKIEIPKRLIPDNYIHPMDREENKGSLEIPDQEIGKGERIVLTAVAQYPEGITREHLTVLTGYKRSTRDAYIQRLQLKGFIRAALGKINITDEGMEILGSDFKPLPTGVELQEHLMRTLPEGERKILKCLINVYSEGLSLTREQLSDFTGYMRSSRDAYIQRLVARQLVVLEGQGLVKASEKLFN